LIQLLQPEVEALDDSESSRFIETRWGIGYRYIGPLQVQVVPYETTLTEIEKTDPPERLVPASLSSTSRLTLTAWAIEWVGAQLYPS